MKIRIQFRSASLLAQVLSVSIFVCIVLMMISCDDADDTPKPYNPKGASLAMIEVYQAMKSWSDLIPDRGNGLFTRVYSLDIENAICSHPDTPVFFIAELTDLKSTSSGIIAEFSSHPMVMLGFPGVLRLRCPEHMKDRLLSHTDNYFSDGFAIIARIRDFSRVIRYEGRVSVDEEFIEDSEVYIEDSNRYVLYGELIDAIYIPKIGYLAAYEYDHRLSEPSPKDDGL